MAKKTKEKPRPKVKGGISVKTLGKGGLQKRNFTKGTGMGDRFKFEDDGKPYAVQFVADITDEDHFIEIQQHQFNDNGWKYVPCLGDNCPLCDDDDANVKKKNYRFITNVYSFKDKKLVILEGPKDLAGRIARRFDRAEKKKKGSFLKTVWDLTRNDSTPVSYDVDENDDRKVVVIDPKKAANLRNYITDSAKRYYGDDSPAASEKSKKKSDKGKKSALDDDEAQEDTFSEKELKKMSAKDLKKVAKRLGIDVEDKKGNALEPADIIKKVLKKQG